MFISLAPSKLKIHKPWDECAAIAANAGFEGIEIPDLPDANVDTYRPALDRHGLRCGGCTLNSKVLRGEEKGYDDYLAALPKQAAILQALDAGCAGIWLAPFSDTRRYRDNFDHHVKRLQPAARILAEHDCRLAIEFLGPVTLRRGHRYPFIHTIEQALELCDAVGHGANLLLDSWHWHTSLGTVDDLRMLEKEHVGIVHINDAPAGVPIEQLMDLERALPAATGVIDIGAFIAELKRMGFDGPVAAEPFDDTLADVPPDEAARVGMEAIRRAMSASPRPVLPATMPALAMGNHKAHTVECPVPRPVGHEVVVKMHASLICGSNMKHFVGDEQRINGGHEGAGEVVAVAQSNRLKVGDRVGLAPVTSCGRCKYCLAGDVLLCRDRPAFEGTFSEYVRISDNHCVKLPDDISYEHGALLGCALGPAYGALRTLGVRAYDTVVVTGLGPVGIGVSALASFMNVRVIAIDPVADRRKYAEEMGVEHTHDGGGDDLLGDLRKIVGGHGMMFGVDCAGRPETQRLLIDLAAPNGRVAFIGENHGSLELCPSNDFLRKQLSVFGVWHMNMNHTDDLIAFLRRRPDLADRIVTHRFSYDQAQEAFDTFAARKAIKVSLYPCGR